MTTERFSSGLRLLASSSAACGATWLVSYMLQFRTIGVDDASIFLVYARNVSAGEGFVFNAGGERVEGFTSLLWVLICAVVTVLPGGPERWLLALNVLLLSVTIHSSVGSLVFRRSPDGASIALPWALGFVAVLLADYRFIAWNTVALMETGLWTCLITVSALLVVNTRAGRTQGTRLALVIGLLILTRPEALIWGAAVLMLFVGMRTSSQGYRAALGLASPAIITYLAAAGLLTAFRLLYFGFPLPNTYYAKVSPSLAFSLYEGVRYLRQYLLSGPVPFTAALAVILSAAHLARVRFNDARTAALCMLAALALLIPMVTGGDHFGGFRFYQSAYPVLLLALVHCARFVLPQYIPAHTLSRFGRRVVLVMGSVTTALFLAVQAVDWMYFEQRLSMDREFEIAQRGRDRGSHADRLFADIDPPPSIGTITVGGFKYAYSGDVVDLMGLNSVRMAHNGGDRVGFRSHAAFEKKTFYELKPAAVIPLIQLGERLSCMEAQSGFVDLVLKGLLHDETFQTAYRLAEVRRVTAKESVAVAAWYEREFLDRLGRSGSFEIVLPSARSEGRISDCAVPASLR